MTFKGPFQAEALCDSAKSEGGGLTSLDSKVLLLNVSRLLLPGAIS